MKNKNSLNKINSTQIRLFRSTLLASVILCLSLSAHAFLTLHETAEMLPENYYQFGLAPQLVLTDGSGLNMEAFVDTPINSDTSLRVTAGGGKTDFYTQASVKWVPFPDIDKQPALGARGGVIYARDEKTDLVGIQITPIISKKADTRYGKMIPYVGLPITFFNDKHSDFVATQFTVGAEWFHFDDKQIGAEFNLNLNNSLTSLSVYVNFPFDSATGFKKR